MTEQEAPVTETPVVDTPAAAAGPSRAQYLQEKLQALRADRATKKSSEDFSAKAKELEAREAKIKEAEQKWKLAAEDPAKGFEALGVKPEQVYARLTDILLDADTPEVKQRQQIEELKRELKGNSPEVEALKKELEEVKARLKGDDDAKLQADIKNAEAEQMRILSDEKFGDLTDFYSEEQLLSAAYEVAKMLHKSGAPYDYQSVAQKMLDIHNGWWDTVSKKRASKQQRSSEESQSEPKAGLSGAKEPKSLTAIGNSVASATASGSERELSKKEKQSRRAAQLKGLFEE